MIRTSAHNITYNFLYELDLTCYDGGPKNNQTSTVMVQVNFIQMTTTGNSAELSALFTKAYMGIVCCIAYILRLVF